MKNQKYSISLVVSIAGLIVLADFHYFRYKIRENTPKYTTDLT